jgi:hypothetical protein
VTHEYGKSSRGKWWFRLKRMSHLPELYAKTGNSRAYPTGLIACPVPCNENYAPAYPRYSKLVSRYAASWEFSGSNFDYLIEYEFENQILNTLGYDMTWS